eukprot:CAMPEP_0118693344 /NCGR_PEP_ID=MMETSP0800-20121206/11850_1 /TAXON_ID=210618 ORGANISM="Striatella unipunctata, Strain CCMP2910" /NCGR_SAMPLE_ID=MMETSP0800 /ASSEMBLY_ACC=CAM_ASM_000638 /LENGTH=585 /DNA_ID=CAMNT_0006591557 /DNA_START=37 /DNA_END=1794 /DNA_ORIENTATION=-
MLSLVSSSCGGSGGSCSSRLIAKSSCGRSRQSNHILQSLKGKSNSNQRRVASTTTTAAQSSNSSSNNNLPKWTLAAAFGLGATATAMLSSTNNNATNCEEGPPVTVLGLLKDIADKVTRLEATLGGSNKGSHHASSSTSSSSSSSSSRKNGIDIVLGGQWGDEGKGKLVDILSQEYDVCARVAGGSNAGHTIVVNNTKYKFHLLPSGMLNPHATCVIGNGVVVHLPSFLNEIDSLLQHKGFEDAEQRILLSDRAHLVFDFHQHVDGRLEARLGRNKLGTTKKGIGPAYASKAQRNGLRVGDLQDWPYFESRFRSLCQHHVRAHAGLEIDVEQQLAFYKSIADRVGKMTTDTIPYINHAFETNKRILVEGANATMLDIDFGTYPFVTSSNPSVGSVLTGLGVSPTKLRGIYGTVKAYCTRVGEGPFPTELDVQDEASPGYHMKTIGAEYGTTTGRGRRCGWLDIPQMKYSSQINGFTCLNLTKLDVLTGLDTIYVGKAYRDGDGNILEHMPANLRTLEGVTVEYEALPGWKEDISTVKTFEDLPPQAQAYVLRVQELIGVPIRWIGVGPNRLDVIDRGEGWDLNHS